MESELRIFILLFSSGSARIWTANISGLCFNIDELLKINQQLYNCL